MGKNKLFGNQSREELIHALKEEFDKKPEAQGAGEEVKEKRPVFDGSTQTLYINPDENILEK